MYLVGKGGTLEDRRILSVKYFGNPYASEPNRAATQTARSATQTSASPNTAAVSNSKPSTTPPTFPTIAVCQVLSINDGSGVIKEIGIGM